VSRKQKAFSSASGHLEKEDWKTDFATIAMLGKMLRGM